MTGGARPSDGPVLVVGSPRSGTTWLGKLLDSHPGTLYSHEPDSVLPARDIPLYIPSERIEDYRDRLRSWVAELKDSRLPRIAAKRPSFRKSYRGSLGHLLWTGSIVLSKTSAWPLRARPIPPFASRGALHRATWIWKSIESSGRLGALARVLESCRSVLLVRHPCGVVSSTLRGEARAEFTSSVPSSEDRGIFELLAETSQAKERGLGLQEFLAMTAVERLAWRWALVNEKAMSDTSGLPNVLLVRYEDLCRDPAAEMARIFDFAGLEWHPQVAEFIRASTSTESSAYYSVFKNPQRSVDKWKEELEPGQIDAVLGITRETAPGRLFVD